jgi:hypothetical protein
MGFSVKVYWGKYCTKDISTRGKEDFQEKNGWNMAIYKAFQALQYTQ